MFSRRFLIAGLAVTPSLIGSAQAQTKAAPTLVFAGHEGSPACKLWRSRAEPEFIKSAAFKKLDYWAVYPKTGELMRKEASWQGDVRWIHAAFFATEEGRRYGDDQPLFILAQDGKIVFTAMGNGGWQDKMLPRIATATGT